MAPSAKDDAAEESGIPSSVIEQAAAAAANNPEPETTNGAPIEPAEHPEHYHRAHASSETTLSASPDSRRRRSIVHPLHHEHEAPIETVPPPAYGSAHIGQVDFEEHGLDTKAKIASDGRVNININQKSRGLANLLAPALKPHLHVDEQAGPYVPPSLAGAPGEAPPPPMNVVIHVVGSRGDVQPFVALGQVLKKTYGHRVRLATHPTFKGFVEENGLEFFSIGGDPTELMAFMVKNPGLMPGVDSLRNGDVGKRRKGMYEIVTGCWRSCIEAGDGSGQAASDDQLGGLESYDSALVLDGGKPFVADAIIANPPSFAHIHCAERLGIPLHLMFTMPWSPTQAFPHPLANIQSTNAEQTMSNFITYALVETLTWQGLGDVINRFREKSLKLEPVSVMWAPGMATRLRIPYTYCWSPALIPKPKDWGPHIDISGFYFLSLATNYKPAEDLQAFLDAGPPPVYIGFGSIVVDDPNAMTKLIFNAVKLTGQRALVSKGWGGFGDSFEIPDGVFMLGNVPHDWLFKHVSCVVHHGGAGTTAAGIALGRPTVVVPFFGDQPFWGSMVARAGAGPNPVPYKTLTAEKLAAAINKALEPASLDRAAELSAKISQEKGAEVGAASFHKHLRMDNLRCVLAPSRTAVWRIKRTDIRLSTFAATVLGNEGLLDFNDLKLYRPCEYETDDGPWDPITGGASALIGTIGSLAAGFADFPVEIARGLQKVATDVPNPSQAKAYKPSLTTPTPSTTEVSAKASTPSTTSTVKSPTESTATPTSITPSRSTTSLVQSPTNESESDVAKEQPVLEKHASVASIDSVSGHRKSLKEHFGRSSPKNPSSPRSGSPARHGSVQRTSTSQQARRHFDVAMDTGKGIHKIVGVGLKSPLDFTLSLARGFHNAPKLYGDETVRDSQRVTDMQSGMKAAATEFGYGFYDGISGLVTQPIAGAKKEGAAGLVKGFGKGIGGLILKPGAAVWGIPGYTAKGIYKELQKHLGSSVSNYIIASRTAQGYEEWRASTHEERLDVVSRWHTQHAQQLKKRKSEAHNIFGDDRKKASDERRKTKREEHEKEKAKSHKKSEPGTAWKPKSRWCPITKYDSGLARSMTFPATHELETEHADFEAAIQHSISATSKGNPAEDKVLERALRASVAELQNSKEVDPNALDRALEASIKEAARARAESEAQAKEQADHEADLRLAMQRSLEDFHLSNQPTHDHPYQDEDSDSSDVDPEGKENFKRALAESKKLHHEKAAVPTDNLDEETKRVMEESKASHEKHGEELTKAKTEEEIVLEYVKKQSLAEVEHKKAVTETTEIPGGHIDDDKENKATVTT